MCHALRKHKPAILHIHWWEHGHVVTVRLLFCSCGLWTGVGWVGEVWEYFFLDFPIYLQAVDTFSKWCVECSVAPLCNKRVKTLCGCREEGVRTKTTKAYKLSYNYINCTINLVGRSFGKWRHRRLRSGGSRRVRRMWFGCGWCSSVNSIFTHALYNNRIARVVYCP
jgi:hypothetical protein